MADFFILSCNLDSKKALSHEDQIVKNCLSLGGRTNSKK